jgi:Tfp pilus assembly protein PilF
MKSSIKIFTFMIAVGHIAACTTTGRIASVDKSKKRIVIQSTDDETSALNTQNTASLIDRSIAIQEKLVRRNPRNIDALINLSQLKIAKMDLKGAEQTIRKALMIDLKNRLAKKILAEIYLRRKNYDMAQVIINGLGGMNSKDSDIANMQAMISYSLGMKGEALVQFKEAIDLDPKNVASRMNLGVLYLNYRQIKNASVQFERVLKIMPDHADAKLHLAVIAATRGNHDEAEQVYRAILRDSKENPLALFNYAALERNRKNFSGAIDTLKRYLDTKYAKQSDNRDAYALIDDIRKSQQEANTKVSDAEINALATQISNMKPVETAKAADIERENPAAPAAAAPEKNDTVNAMEAQPPGADDIESLERELQ